MDRQGVPAMNAIDPVYRPREAAAILKISKATLFRYIAAGRLRARKIGPNVTVILAEDLAAFRAGEGASMQPGCIAAHHTAEVRHNQVANAHVDALSPGQRPDETGRDRARLPKTKRRLGTKACE